MATESKSTALRFAQLTDSSDLTQRVSDVDVLLAPDAAAGKYKCGFAVSNASIERALRLRYEVFNLELGEGLDESVATGLDRDEFDDQMSHLVVFSNEDELIGTYRIQTATHAMKTGGLYAAREYDLTGMAAYLPETVETGRACLAQDHRNFSAIYALWLGIGAFMNVYSQRYVFGCCSLTTTDPDDGWRALKTIREKDFLHEEVYLPATQAFSCGGAQREFDPAIGDPIRLPKLFRTYMRLGTKVISEPAIDRAFGTVDFLVLLDGKKVAMAGLDVLK